MKWSVTCVNEEGGEASWQNVGKQKTTRWRVSINAMIGTIFDEHVKGEGGKAKRKAKAKGKATAKAKEEKQRKKKRRKRSSSMINKLSTCGYGIGSTRLWKT